MLERIVSLFERLVAAVETIASAQVTGRPSFPTVTPAHGAVSPAQGAVSPAQGAVSPAQGEALTPAQKTFLDMAKGGPPQTAMQLGQSPAVTRDQVGNALISLATGKGRDAAVNLLAQFGGAKQLRDVKEADYGKLLDAITKAAA